MFGCSIMAEIRFWSLDAHQTVNDVIIQLSNRGFLLVLNTYILCILNRLKVISDFRLVINGGMSILAVR
jgi:hypothetical protein